MREIKKLGTLFGIGILLYAQSSNALVYSGVSVSDGQSLTINKFDTMLVKYNGEGLSGGVIDNYGLIKISNVDEPNGGSDVVGTLNNYGNIFWEAGSTATGMQLFNKPSGYIVLTNYVDMYGNVVFDPSTAALIDNAGTFVVANSIGNESAINMPFTYAFGGTLRNTGKFLIERTGSVCINARQLIIQNAGFFQVAAGSTCNWATGAATETSSTGYNQDGGETQVNGLLGAHRFRFYKGMLSGNGVLSGAILGGFGSNTTIAPGAPVGGLTINGNSSLSCSGCSINIDLASATSSDHLHVNGAFNAIGLKLNVQLRDGFAPAPGTRFSLITANSILLGSSVNDIQTRNLPKLPNGRTWSFQQTATELTLIAN